MSPLTLVLSDETVATAKAKGLSSPTALEEFLLAKILEDDNRHLPEGYDPRLLGLVDPELFRQGTIHGDIMAPASEPWEADSLGSPVTADHSKNRHEKRGACHASRPGRPYHCGHGLGEQLPVGDAGQENP